MRSFFASIYVTIAYAATPFLVLLAAMLFVGMVAGKPAKVLPVKPKEKVEMLPMLAGNTNWGKWTQASTSIQINGHASWYAVGEFRKNSKVQII